MSILVADGGAAETSQVAVSSLDAAHSMRRSAVVVGPLKLPSHEVLTARLAAMTAAGPAARVCLAPSATSTKWSRSDTAQAPRLHALAPVPDAIDPAELLQIARSLDDRAVTVLTAGDWLTIDFSHGLGEIPLIHTLLDVLFGLTDPRDPDVWRNYEKTRSPLRSATLKTFGRNPVRLAKLLAYHGIRRPTATPDAVATTEFVPSPATRAVCLTAGQLSDLRARRDAALPGVSMVALFTFALRTAFGRAGFPVSDTVKIPFDVRRYLPKGADTLASFSAGLDFTIDDEGGPAALQRAMTRATRTGRPVANLLVATAKARRAAHANMPTEAVAVSPRLNMLHSNLGWGQWNGPWPFIDRRKACMLVASDPATPAGVTVTSAGVTENLWFTAEFHETVHDPDAIGAALQALPATVADLTEDR